MSYFLEAPRLVILGSAGALSYSERAARCHSACAVCLPSPRSRCASGSGALPPVDFRDRQRNYAATARNVELSPRAAISVSVIKTPTYEWNWMCTYLEEVSATARGRTAAGVVDFCKLISPVHFDSAKQLIKSFLRSETAIKWIWGNISNYKWTVCFRVQLLHKTFKLDPNNPIAPPMVVKLPGENTFYNSVHTRTLLCINI